MDFMTVFRGEITSLIPAQLLFSYHFCSRLAETKFLHIVVLRFYEIAEKMPRPLGEITKPVQLKESSVRICPRFDAEERQGRCIGGS
jgi:hypothetical protein